jgi:hypothetical protein
MFVDSIRTNTGHFANALLAKRWSIVFSEEPVFITTDAPVVFSHQTRAKLGYGTPGVHISVPLSPTRILSLDDMHDEPGNQYYPLKEHEPAPFNYSAWVACERFMISPRSTDQVCAEILAWGDVEDARVREDAGRR